MLRRGELSNRLIRDWQSGNSIKGQYFDIVILGCSGASDHSGYVMTKRLASNETDRPDVEPFPSIHSFRYRCSRLYTQYTLIIQLCFLQNLTYPFTVVPKRRSQASRVEHDVQLEP